jgi:hypothetical protein
MELNNQINPAVETEAEDIMQGVRKTQSNIRNEFRSFLRSTLSVLEEDIVENIIHVYNHHCTQEDDVLAASLLVAKDNIEKKYFPFIRTFQSSLNEASRVCSKPCLATIKKEHENFKGLKSQNIVHFEGENNSKTTSTWREGDLQIIGSLNDMISWGQSLRQVMLSHYRGHVEAVEKKKNLLQNKKLKPLLTDMNKKTRKRPSTAGKLRKPNRRPPVGGGFRSSFSIEGDALATMGMGETLPNKGISIYKNISMGAGYTAGDGRRKNQVMQRANEMRHQSRTMLRNVLGSYYNFDDSKLGQRGYLNQVSTSGNHVKKTINNAFKAKRPLRSNFLSAEDETKNQKFRIRPSSAQPARRRSGVNSVKDEFSNVHNNRPSSAGKKRRKPFDMPRGDGNISQYGNSNRISKSLNSLNFYRNAKNEQELNNPENYPVDDIHDMTQILHISPNNCVGNKSNACAIFKANDTPVSSKRQKSNAKKTIRDMTLEKAALSPWGKDEEIEGSHNNERTIFVKKKSISKSASSKKEINRGSFKNKDFGVVGNSLKGN